MFVRSRTSSFLSALWALRLSLRLMVGEGVMVKVTSLRILIMVQFWHFWLRLRVLGYTGERH